MGRFFIGKSKDENSRKEFGIEVSIGAKSMLAEIDGVKRSQSYCPCQSQNLNICLFYSLFIGITFIA